MDVGTYEGQTKELDTDMTHGEDIFMTKSLTLSSWKFVGFNGGNGRGSFFAGSGYIYVYRKPNQRKCVIWWIPVKWRFIWVSAESAVNREDLKVSNFSDLCGGYKNDYADNIWALSE